MDTAFKLPYESVGPIHKKVIIIIIIRHEIESRQVATRISFNAHGGTNVQKKIINV